MSKICKRVIKSFTIIVLAAVLMIAGITPAMAAEKSPTLNSTEQTILMGKEYDFNVVNEIEGSTYQWRSSNPKVAVVDANGIVKGIGKGNCNIHCIIKTPQNKNYRLLARVTVIKPAVKVVITNKIDHMNVDDSYKLNATIIPESSTDSITWSTSDKSIADPADNGAFRAKKPGVVTLTATALSGRKDSVTIRVLGEGEEYIEPEEPEEPEVEEPVEEDTLPAGTVFYEGFETSTGAFVGRGSAYIQQENKPGADGKNGYLKVMGREANWHGANVDVTSYVVPGRQYEVSGWVMYTEGNATEVFKITQQKNGGSWPQITGEVTVEKGKWTKLSGIMTVDNDTVQCEVYFESPSNDYLEFLCDELLIVDPTGVPAPVEETPVKELPEGVVYKNDFEDGSVLDSRASSVRTNTTEAAHGGKASVKVTRSNAWDGAGVRFLPANGINKADYYGKTLHVSMYVMYKDGPDTMEFKLNNRMGDAAGGDNILSQISVTKGKWTLIEGDAYIAEGTAGNLVFVETVDALETFYIDDVEIKLAD
jgi:hypothetical protein